MTPEVALDLFAQAFWLTITMVLVIVGPSLAIGDGLHHRSGLHFNDGLSHGLRLHSLELVEACLELASELAELVRDFVVGLGLEEILAGLLERRHDG